MTTYQARRELVYLEWGSEIGNAEISKLYRLLVKVESLPFGEHMALYRLRDSSASANPDALIEELRAASGKSSAEPIDLIGTLDDAKVAERLFGLTRQEDRRTIEGRGIQIARVTDDWYVYFDKQSGYLVVDGHTGRNLGLPSVISE